LDVTPLEDAVISANRRSIEVRYDDSNLERLAGLNQLPPESVRDIRSFFLDRLYPAPEKRRELDEALSRLGDVLRSPRKMLHVTGASLGSIFKLGGMFPRAASAGFHTLEVYLDIRRIEKQAVAFAREKNWSPEDLAREANFSLLMADLPEKNVLHFRRELLKLFKSLADTELLKATIRILDDSGRVMRTENNLFTPQELQGLELGRELLAAGLHLYDRLRPEQIELVIRGVEQTETDWYERILAQAREYNREQ